MKQHWQSDPLPPPEESTDGEDGFISFALLVFVIIGPIIYFAPVLRSVEAWAMNVYQTIEAWILPIRNWLIG